MTSMNFATKSVAAESSSNEVSLLNGAVTSSNDESRGTGDDYQGMITSCYDLNMDYFKITYTVDDASKLESWTWLLNIQPFTSSWGGWQCNAITLSDSTFANGEYTAYMTLDQIKESCTDGEVAGLNLSYCEVVGTAVTVTGFYACTGKMPGTEEDSSQESNVIPSTSSNEYVKALGDGWNLGNTFDSFDTNLNVPDLRENTWGNPDVTKELIQGIKAKGYKSIRVPMTVFRRYTEENGEYIIDETWLARYKEVVDWCVEEGFYVMINMHHDSVWLRDWDGNKSSQQYKLYVDCWEQIADYFKDEPDTVFFETINEPQFDYNTADNTKYDKLNAINEAAYNIIRNSGGNNGTRMIVIPSYNTNQEAESLDNLYNFITALKDENIIATIHYYSEWCFSANLGTTGFDDKVNGGELSAREALDKTFTKVYNQFVANGIGVIVGEYGLLGSWNGNEVGEYVKYLEHVTAVGHKDGFCMMFWDAGNYINRYDTENYAWYEPRLGAVMEAGMTSRSSTAACLDELFFDKEVTEDVEIPLYITEPEFVGIKGLVEGIDYTYDADKETILLKPSYVNCMYATLTDGEYGTFDDLVIQFTSGADWHEYLNKITTPVVGKATGSTDGITLPITYNGTKIRRISAFQRGGGVGACHTWCKYLQFGEDFLPDYENNELAIKKSFLGDSSIENGAVLVDVEMWDGQILAVWLNKDGSTFTCDSAYAEEISANLLTPEKIVVYVGEDTIPSQYINLPEGAKLFGTWTSDDSVMKMDGWPATITFSKTPTDFVAAGIVVYYYDITHYVGAQFAVKEKPEVSSITVDAGNQSDVVVSNVTNDAVIRYTIADTSVATVDNGVVYGKKAGTTTLTVTVTQYGRTDDFTALVKVNEVETPATSETPIPSETSAPIQTGVPAVLVETSNGGTVTQKYTICKGTMDELDLSKLVIRYKYTTDDNKVQNLWIDNAGVNLSTAPYYLNYTSNVCYTFGTDYVEISFTEVQCLGDGSMSLQLRMNNADWSSYSNFKEIGLEVYYDGQLILTQE